MGNERWQGEITREVVDHLVGEQAVVVKETEERRAVRKGFQNCSEKMVNGVPNPIQRQLGEKD